MEPSGGANMRILAISGSLRAASINSAALEAARALAPPGVTVTLYRGLGRLPHFNPDHDGDDPPAVVRDLRAAVGVADALLIACPEYAHGVPGSLKNALDWLVSGAEFPGKPVALINTAPRASIAQAALREILTTMSARLVPEASVTLPIGGQPVTAAEIAADPDMAGLLAGALGTLRDAAAATMTAASPVPSAGR